MFLIIFGCFGRRHWHVRLHSWAPMWEPRVGFQQFLCPSAHWQKADLEAKRTDSNTIIRELTVDATWASGSDILKFRDDNLNTSKHSCKQCSVFQNKVWQGRCWKSFLTMRTLTYSTQGVKMMMTIWWRSTIKINRNSYHLKTLQQSMRLLKMCLKHGNVEMRQRDTLLK